MKIKELPGYGKFKKLCDVDRCEKYYPGWTGEEKYLIITDASEELLRAEFLEIMKQLSPYVIVGKYFQQMNEAERYSDSKYRKMTVSLDQLIEQGKEWITVQLEELNAEGEKGLREWLKNAEMGDISDPIDFDDGVSIVGVVRKGEGEAPEGVVGPTLYTLVRCTMLARNNMEVPTADEVRKAVLEFKRGEARREVFTNLYHAATIEFPNGTNFFPNAGRRAAGK